VKILSFLVRALFFVGFSVVVWAVYFYDLAREHAMKRKLGNRYEGPAEG
jgi:protein-S-isoprenylcysteine O-methyltransferase Ste14